LILNFDRDANSCEANCGEGLTRFFLFGYFRGGAKGLMKKIELQFIGVDCRHWQYWIPILIKLFFCVV